MALPMSGVGFFKPAVITLAIASLGTPHWKKVEYISNYNLRVVTQECGRTVRISEHTQGGYSCGYLLSFVLLHRI